MFAKGNNLGKPSWFRVLGVVLACAVASWAAGMFIGLFVWALVNAAFLACDVMWNFLAWDASIPWSVSPQPRWAVLPVAICVLGGLAMGAWNARFHSEPKSLNQTMDDIRSGKMSASAKDDGAGESNVQSKPPLAARLVSYVMPIAFGGAVGPFPGLLGLAASGSAWFKAKVFDLAARLGYRGTPTKIQRYTFYGVAIVGGIVGIAVGRRTIGGILVIPRFAPVSLAPDQLLAQFAWLVPLALAGSGLAFLFAFWMKLLSKAGLKMGDHPVLKPVICGAVLGVAGLVLPLALFSGSQQAVTLMVQWSQVSPWIMIATGLVKTFCVALCFTFGWMGGPFFPLAFCGITFGYGLSGLTALDPMLCVTAITCALVGAFSRKPLLAFLLLLLIFPLESLPYIVASLAIGLGVAFAVSRCGATSR